jgi:lysophospholipase L1-like esterase
MPSPRSPARKLLRAAVALLLGLALCELLLRGAGLGFLALHGRRPGGTPLGPDGLTLVCLGDSNTFGVYEDAQDSYPARLEALLDARMPGGPHRVVNLGIPGMNTRQVLSALPEALDTYAPDAVLVMAGVNNLWSWTADSSIEYEAPPWYEELRLVKLWRVLWARAAAPHAPAVAPDLGWGEGMSTADLDPDAPKAAKGRDRAGRSFAFVTPPITRRIADSELERSVEHDLRAIAEAAREQGTPLVLLTYASRAGSYGAVNALVRRLAPEIGAQLVDAELGVAALAGRFGQERLFYMDNHPKALGYEVIARQAYDGLVASGLARGEPFAALDDGLAPPDPWRGELRAVPAGAGAPPALEVVGEEPGRPVVFLLSGSGAGPRARVGELELPLRDDSIFRSAVLDPRLRSVVGADGSARVELARVGTPATWAELSGKTLQAVCVVLHRPGSAVVRCVSRELSFAVP